MGLKNDSPLVKVTNEKGKEILTTTPIVVGVRREVVQSFLPVELRGMRITTAKDLEEMRQEVGDFDVKEELRRVREVIKTSQTGGT